MTDLRKQLDEILLNYAREDDSDNDWPAGVWLGEKDEAITALEALFTTELQKAEGRGRLAAVDILRKWADSTEVTYNEMIQQQLDSLPQLNQLEEGP